MCRPRKDWEVGKFLDGRYLSRLVLHSGKNHYACTRYRRYWFAQPAGGKNVLQVQWPRGIYQNNIDIARQRKMLKSIVE